MDKRGNGMVHHQRGVDDHEGAERTAPVRAVDTGEKPRLFRDARSCDKCLHGTDCVSSMNNVVCDKWTYEPGAEG